jgi:hypothetical protein
MQMYKEVHLMSYPVVCPKCGSTRLEDHLERGNGAGSDASRSETRFARVLNGLEWREKPIAPPRNRDDIVPND